MRDDSVNNFSSQQQGRCLLQPGPQEDDRCQEGRCCCQQEGSWLLQAALQRAQGKEAQGPGAKAKKPKAKKRNAKKAKKPKVAKIPAAKKLKKPATKKAMNPAPKKLHIFHSTILTHNKASIKTIKHKFSNI